MPLKNATYPKTLCCKKRSCNKKELQSYNPDITARCIIGLFTKPNVISDDVMYSILFKNFKKEIRLASKILISGYSYSDEHINKELKKIEDIEIINQNPKNEYPYSTSKKVKQLDNLEYLRKP